MKAESKEPFWFQTDEKSYPDGNLDISRLQYTACSYPTKLLSDLKPNYANEQALLNFQKSFLDLEINEGFTMSKDRRKPVNSSDVPNRHSQFPFSAIVSLDVIYSDNSYMAGSGCMIGSRYVLTSAHLVKRKAGMPAKIFASPGRHKNNFPFGVVMVSRCWFFNEFSPNGQEVDLALLALEDEIGEFTGWFGIKDVNENNLKPFDEAETPGFFEHQSVYVTGYNPLQILKTGNKMNLLPQVMMSHCGDVIDRSNFKEDFRSPDFIAYDADTVEGQSGSPVWVREGINFYVIAIHSRFIPSRKANLGVKLSSSLLTQLQIKIRTDNVKGECKIKSDEKVMVSDIGELRKWLQDYQSQKTDIELDKSSIEMRKAFEERRKVLETMFQIGLEMKDTEIKLYEQQKTCADECREFIKQGEKTKAKRRLLIYKKLEEPIAQNGKNLLLLQSFVNILVSFFDPTEILKMIEKCRMVIAYVLSLNEKIKCEMLFEEVLKELKNKDE